MTGVARFGSRNMRSAFADGDRAVMAAFARAGDFGMIHGDQRNPAAALEVAGIAVIAGSDVGGVFADDRTAVVTADAGAEHFVMVYCRGHDRRPGGNHMAGFAHSAGADMRSTLAAGDGAIMTADAGGRTDGAVVKGTNEPVQRAVADFAGLDSRYVSCTFPD